MKKKINFTAIIAVAMIAMSVLLLGSCNADDDDYNFEYGTLAKGVMTRAGEGTTQPQTQNVHVSDTTYASYAISLESTCPEISIGKYNINVNVMIYQEDNNLIVNLLSYDIYSAYDRAIGPYGPIDTNLFNFEGVHFEKDVYPYNRYYLCAGGTNGIGVHYKGKVENLLFFVQ